MRHLFSLAALLALAPLAFASATRTVNEDVLKSADETKTWSMPAATDTLVGRASTDTLTNKSLSGATNTFTLIPGTAIDSATPVTVPKGGTGVSSLASGNVVLGAGTSPVTVVAPGTSGNCLVSNGSTWTSTTCTSSGGIAYATIPVNFVEGLNSPIAVNFLSTGNALNSRTYAFMYNSDATQALYVMIRVPDTYVPGHQIFLKAAFVSTGTSGTVDWGIGPELYKVGGTQNFFSGSSFLRNDSQTVTLSASTANRPQVISLGVTNASGQIGLGTVAAGDWIEMNFYRIPGDTSTVDAILIADTGQVEF